MKAKWFVSGSVFFLMVGCYMLPSHAQDIRQLSVSAKSPLKQPLDSLTTTSPVAQRGETQVSAKRRVQIMTFEPSFALSQSQVDAHFFCSVQQKQFERKLLPGVTFNGSQVSIETNEPNRTITIQRDHTYGGDYQVMWQKKY